MSELKAQLRAAVEQAMRERDKLRLKTLRGIQAAIKQKEVDGRKALDDTEVLKVLQKRARQHRDAIEQFSRAQRAELLETERSELEILQSFMPEPPSEDTLQRLILTAIDDIDAHGIQDMGRVMTSLQNTLQGQADMATVGRMVRARLEQR